MADRGDINERVATLESAVSDLKDEKTRTRDKMHAVSNKITAHNLDIDWMRPVVERLERAYQRTVGMVLLAGALGGLIGLAITKLFHGG